MARALREPRRCRTLSIEELEARTARVLASAGLGDEHAETVARVLVDAEVRGHPSHGIRLLPVYLRRIREGGINRAPRPRWIRDDPALAILDSDDGPGQVAATMAAVRCAALAAQAGIGAVAVRNNNHVGMLAAYRGAFEEAGVVGLILNLSGASVAPPGGARPTMGNNAICLIVPQPERPSWIVDMATGTVACGKIREAAAGHATVPSGWLLDSEGRPSSDPSDLDRGGSVPVFGGHKGLALSLIIEILAGALAGQRTAREVKRQRLNPHLGMGCSQLFLGFLPDAFGLGDTTPFVEELCAAVLEGYATEPIRPFFPEQAERGAATRAAESGLSIPPDLAAALELEEA